MESWSLSRIPPLWVSSQIIQRNRKRNNGERSIHKVRGVIRTYRLTKLRSWGLFLSSIFRKWPEQGGGFAKKIPRTLSDWRQGRAWLDEPEATGQADDWRLRKLGQQWQIPTKAHPDSLQEHFQPSFGEGGLLHFQLGHCRRVHERPHAVRHVSWCYFGQVEVHQVPKGQQVRGSPDEEGVSWDSFVFYACRWKVQTQGSHARIFLRCAKRLQVWRILVRRDTYTSNCARAGLNWSRLAKGSIDP